jgi:hypothetical protein
VNEPAHTPRLAAEAARAAAAIYGLDRFEERHWRQMEEALALTMEAG